MSSELVVREFNSDEIALIKDTVCRGSTDNELKLFLYQCARTGLDPLSRQIHAVKRWDASLQREAMAIQTGIDGYRLIADRTERYAGSEDARFELDEKGGLFSATVTVWKLVQGQRCPFTATAYWSEYAQFKKDGTPNVFWKNRPRLMLSKCAESLALRKAFPQELSGVYTHEEMGTEMIEEAEAEPVKIESKPNGKPKEEPSDLRKKALAILEQAAKHGTNSLASMWATLAPNMKKAAEGDKDRLKKVAADVDAKQNQDAEPPPEMAGVE
jgi:phage recombination protein Bet